MAQAQRISRLTALSLLQRCALFTIICARSETLFFRQEVAVLACTAHSDNQNKTPFRWLLGVRNRLAISKDSLHSIYLIQHSVYFY